MELLLAFRFLGCVCTYRIGETVLVEGVGVRSPEFLMFCLHGTGIILYGILPSVGKWRLFAVLPLWLVIRFFRHWYYTLFGATEEKLKEYNACFSNTLHIIPASETRLIPDLYHMILHLLILVILTIIFQGGCHP